MRELFLLQYMLHCTLFETVVNKVLCLCLFYWKIGSQSISHGSNDGEMMNRKLRVARLMLLEDLQMSEVILLLHQQVELKKDGVFDQYAQAP